MLVPTATASNRTKNRIRENPDLVSMFAVRTDVAGFNGRSCELFQDTTTGWKGWLPWGEFEHQ